MSRFDADSLTNLCRKALQLTPVSFREELREAVEAAEFPALHEVLLAVNIRADSTRRLRNLVSEIADLSVDTTADADLETSLGRILSLARQMLGSDAAFVMELDEEADRASIMLSSGIWTTELQEASPSGDGLFYEIYRVAAPLQVANYLRDSSFVHDPELDTAIKREGMRAALGIPIETENAFQVLFVADRYERIYHTGDIYILEQLATQVEAVVTRADERHHFLQKLTKYECGLDELSASKEELDRHQEGLESLMSIACESSAEAKLGAFLSESLGIRVEVISVEELSAFSSHGSPRGGVYLRAEQHVRNAGIAGENTTISEEENGAFVSAIVRGGRPWGAVMAQPVPEGFGPKLCVAAAQMLSVRDSAESEAGSQRSIELSNLFFALMDVGLFNLSRRQRDLLADFELVDDKPTRLAVFGGEEADLMSFADECKRLSRGDVLIGISQEHIGLLGRAERLVKMLEDISHRFEFGAHAVVGQLSEEFTGVGGAREKYRECMRILEDIRALKISARNGWFTEASLPQSLRLLTQLTPQQRESLVDGTIGALIRYDREKSTDLVSTVRSLVSHQFSVSAVAQELFVHVNTVRHRTRKVEDLLGPGWNEGMRLLDLQLALTALATTYQVN
ncbi:helix-turn-helix domain-containing protein [Corynebacterium sp.]|uniref:helix-turn-helix domain-containing protein n=1 Tax=Corynebacterium sp. TaxID=1720 RepID=UPI0026DCC324|nr:helix-turn-helix domain-containing protein [Corynebacterium sp.]MDO5032136.1 helix-turn-helix domain-containing protein [Corynebacterium sp.]